MARANPPYDAKFNTVNEIIAKSLVGIVPQKKLGGGTVFANNDRPSTPPLKSLMNHPLALFRKKSALFFVRRRTSRPTRSNSWMAKRHRAIARCSSPSPWAAAPSNAWPVAERPQEDWKSRSLNYLECTLRLNNMFICSCFVLICQEPWVPTDTKNFRGPAIVPPCAAPGTKASWLGQLPLQPFTGADTRYANGNVCIIRGFGSGTFPNFRTVDADNLPCYQLEPTIC